MEYDSSQFLPIAVPDLTDEEISEVVDTLKSGWISVGPRVAQLEEEMAERQGTRHAIAVSSCTAALFLVAKALEIGPGDVAVVPSMTWPSTANVFEQLGASCAFADVDRRTGNITAETIAPLLDEHGGSVKIVVPVHMSGLPVDIDAIDVLAEQHGVQVVYDAAHAIFSYFRDRPIGSYGTASCFSFYAIKNLTMGDGGVITTDDDKLAESIRLWGYHGMNKDAWKRYSAEAASPHVQCVVPGYKMNLTDLQAALGLVQLRRSEELCTNRNSLVETYNALLGDVTEVEIPVFATDSGRWGNHVYGIRLLDDRMDRDQVMDRLRERGIGTNIHFQPVHQHHYYRQKYPDVSLPNSEWLGERLISLPLCSAYAEGDVRRVVDALRETLATIE
jgi:UDP-4-amino-4-deoxy-L-arabinose-oxoglutarate aminotransferase